MYLLSRCLSIYLSIYTSGEVAIIFFASFQKWNLPQRGGTEPRKANTDPPDRDTERKLVMSHEYQANTL